MHIMREQPHTAAHEGCPKASIISHTKCGRLVDIHCIWRIFPVPSEETFDNDNHPSIHSGHSSTPISGIPKSMIITSEISNPPRGLVTWPSIGNSAQPGIGGDARFSSIAAKSLFYLSTEHSAASFNTQPDSLSSM